MNARYAIVVPVFNAEKYLGDCLDSIYRQTYHDYEVVLVNDGSTDSSLQICELYRQAHPNVRTVIVNQKNRGLLAARRAGFKASDADYVWAVDADDLVREDALKVIDSINFRDIYDVVLFEADRGIKPTFRLPNRCAFSADRSFTNERELYDLLLAFSEMRINSMCMKVIRRSVLDPTDDYFDWGRLQNCEDGLQTCDVLTRTTAAYYLRDSLYFYRQDNTGSIVHNYYDGYYAELCDVTEYCDSTLSGIYGVSGDNELARRLRLGFLRIAFIDYRKLSRLTGPYDALVELVEQPYYSDAMRINGDSRFDVRLFHGLVNRKRFVLATALACLDRMMWRAKMSLHALVPS